MNAGIATANAPNTIGRSYTITANVDVPQGGGNGMIATVGGRWGGWGLYIVNGKPIFDYNMLILAHYRWVGQDVLTAGKHNIVFDYTYDGPGIAKGGSGVLKVDGKVVATGKQANSIAFLEVADEPFAFNGKIDKLAIHLGPMQLTAADQTKQSEAVARASD